MRFMSIIKSQLNEKRTQIKETCKRDPLHYCGKNCHALYTDARHVHEHDVGHEHGHDAEGWESCTYGDIGVAGLAVFKQDLVNLPGKEVSIGSKIKYKYRWNVQL